MVGMPKPEMCLYGEDAYTVDVPIRRMYLYNDMKRVRVFAALFHLWYARGYFPTMIQSNTCLLDEFVIAAIILSKAVVRMNGMIVPPPTEPSAALKTELTDNCIINVE